MGEARRNYLIGICLLLAAGALVGWFYGRPSLGLLVAALTVVAMQVRHLLLFEKALRTDDFAGVRIGNAFWSRAFARLEKLRNRGQKHKKRYRRLLKEVRKSTRAMPDGAIILDDHSRIVVCNPAAQKLVGFDPRLDRGQRVDNILRDPQFGAYLHADEFEQGIEIRSPLTDGDWLYCRIVPYGQNQRLLLIRDVTDRVRLNKMRRDFVANASHELRSPLTVISGYLDAMASDADIPSDWQRPLTQMQVQAARMTGIVSELIELSRLETAGAAPEDSDVDVPSLIAAAARAYDDRPDTPGIRVAIDTDAHLYGSATDIESVIGNLLSNAVRHTPEGGSITVRWGMDGEGAALSVADTGEGISAAHLPRLTERFFRVDKGRSRDEGGVGLGLAIVKYALGRHGAELDIDSTVGEGSTFTCRFPPERVAAPPGYAAAAP